MANLQAVYYSAANSSEPVDSFIERLSAKKQVVLDNQIDRLNMLTSARRSVAIDPLINFGNMSSVMPRRQHPAGTPVAEASRRRARRSAAYRREQARLAPYEEIARIVLKHRMARGLTQAELAERMGTSHSAISRIESGQHKTTVATLQRLAEALGLRFVVGFESGPSDRPVRDLVAA